MKKRNILRRINRGIALGVLLMIGLIVYLSVDAAAFSSEKTAIEVMLTAYSKEAEGMMILPEGVRKPGEKTPSDAITQMMDRNKPVLAKYLTDSVSWGSSAYKSVQSSLEYALKNNKDRCAYVTECQFEIIKISQLKKIGTNIAVGNVVVRTSIKTIGQPSYLKFFVGADAGTDNGNGYYSGTLGGDIYYDYSGGNASIPQNNAEGQNSQQEIDTEVHSYSNEITYTDVYFKKINGNWKVAEVNGFSN